MTATMFNFGVVIEKARRLKMKMEEIEERHKEELAPYKKAKEQLDAILLDALNKSGQQNASTPAGGCHKVTRVSWSLENPDEFMRHVVGTESWELLDRKVNATAAAGFLETHNQLPPGTKRSEIVSVNTTAPRAKSPRVTTNSKSTPIEGAINKSAWAEAEAEADQELEAMEAAKAAQRAAELAEEI